MVALDKYSGVLSVLFTFGMFIEELQVYDLTFNM